MSKRERDAEKEQYWRLVMEEFGGSGLSVRAFCRREGLREPSFYAWRRALRERDGDAISSARPKGRRDGHRKNMARASAPVPPSLVEVVTRPTAAGQAIEIETPAGFTIRLGGEVDRDLVASVLSGVLSPESVSC